MKIKIKKLRFGNNKEPRKKNRAKKLRHILVAAAGLVLVLSAAYIAAKTVGNVAVSNITDAFRKTFMSSSNGGWPLTVDILGIKEIKPVGGEILILSNDEAQLVTQHARTMGRIQFNASDSRTAVCNGRILAYDTAKGNVVLLSKTEKLTEISAGEKIYTACLAQNGGCGKFAFGIESSDEAAGYQVKDVLFCIAQSLCGNARGDDGVVVCHL